MPTRKPRVPKTADDKEQSERFIKTAREVEADETGKGLEKAFKKLSEKPPPKKADQDS